MNNKEKEKLMIEKLKGNIKLPNFSDKYCTKCGEMLLISNEHFVVSYYDLETGKPEWRAWKKISCPALKPRKWFQGKGGHTELWYYCDEGDACWIRE